MGAFICIIMNIYYDAEQLCEPDRLDLIYMKRMECLNKAFHLILGSSQIDATKFHLSKVLTGRVVDQYLSEYQLYKLKYRVRRKLQLHRVAGLLVFAIMKYRPIQINNNSKMKTDCENRINELYALTVGLSICSEHHAFIGDDIQSILDKKPELFEKWRSRMLFLLDCGDFNGESLAMIFETFCMDYYPKNFSTEN